MKFLKWLLIILLILAGILLIVPVFLPSQATVTMQTEIDVKPELVFHNLGQFTGRDQWDPWLKTEPEAVVKITPRDDYVGSVYTWNGDKIGTGKMKVDSVHYPDYVASDIWFGESSEPSRVEWILEKNGEGTIVTWKFTSSGTYPFGRLMLVMMKKALESSFEEGLADFKKYIENNPPRLYKLSEIQKEESYPTNAMVVAAEGTVKEVGEQMMMRFPQLNEVIAGQGLSVNGPAFTHYLDYDPETGYSHVLFGIPVGSEGEKSGDIFPKFYEAVEAVGVTHYGDYEYFSETYEKMEQYIMENDIAVTGEAFEVYITSMMESPNPMNWKTMIAFPLAE